MVKMMVPLKITWVIGQTKEVTPNSKSWRVFVCRYSLKLLHTDFQILYTQSATREPFGKNTFRQKGPRGPTAFAGEYCCNFCACCNLPGTGIHSSTFKPCHRLNPKLERTLSLSPTKFSECLKITVFAPKCTKNKQERPVFSKLCACGTLLRFSIKNSVKFNYLFCLRHRKNPKILPHCASSRMVKPQLLPTNWTSKRHYH